MSLKETAQIAYDLAKKVANIELQEQMIKLREEAIEVQEENFELRKENLELKKKIESRESIRFERNVYWQDGDDVPFCPYCIEKSKVSIHLSGPNRIEDDGQLRGLVYACQECATEYFTKEEGDFSIWSGRHRK